MGTASSIDPERYAVLGLTHVQYDPADPWAKLFALVTLSPIFLLCSYVTIIFYRRELTFINALIGQLSCEGINWGLKRLIRQPRPTGHLGKGYGMPSSHCQFLGFFCAFFLAHFYLHHPRAAKPPTLINTMRRLEHWLAMLCIIALTVLTCYSRWHLSYHSTTQVFFGIAIGIFLGSSYYYVTEYLSRQPLRLPAPLGSPISSPASSPTKKRNARLDQSSRDPRLDDQIQATALRMRKILSSSQIDDSTTSQQEQHPPNHQNQRRSSIAALMPELHPAPPLRQLILDHPIAVALRLRDSWTVWLDGGIEGEYEAWRAKWKSRRPAMPAPGLHADATTNHSISASVARAQRESPAAEPENIDDITFFAGPGAVQPDLDASLKALLTDTLESGTTSTSSDPHYSLILRTLQLAAKCPPTTTAFCVGCVITIRGTDSILSSGFSRETGDAANEHAEQVALQKLISGGNSTPIPLNEEQNREIELDLYTSMEPCSERMSGALPCVQRIIAFNANGTRVAITGLDTPRRLRISRVFQALAEPADFIAENTSPSRLRSQGIELVTVLPPLKANIVERGWIEREALRLAKNGHSDQPAERNEESLGWKCLPPL